MKTMPELSLLSRYDFSQISFFTALGYGNCKLRVTKQSVTKATLVDMVDKFAAKSETISF